MGLLLNIWKTFVGSQKTDLPIPEKQEVAIAKPKKQISHRKKTKINQIKTHLLENGSIDSWTAIQLYGVTRLSAIVFKLRMSGYNIDSIPNTAYDRNQELCNFTTYKYINYNGTN
jgi:hypothetical protein